MIDLVGIECNKCSLQWRLEIIISKNSVESFATICECGAIIVGNRKNNIRDDLPKDMILKERYLTNGSYSIISNENEIVKNLPLLELE